MSKLVKGRVNEEKGVRLWIQFRLEEAMKTQRVWYRTGSQGELPCQDLQGKVLC